MRKCQVIFERALTPSLKANGINLFTDFSADSLKEAVEKFLAQANQGKDGSAGRSYVAIQAYVKPTMETYNVMQDLRTRLQKKCRMATTIGYGPRFLHSTGQLHKGDGGHGLFIQITADMPEDVPIPDQTGEEASSISFGVLKMAQALGDRQTLLDSGRKVIRFHLGKDMLSGLKQIMEALA